MEKRTLVLVFSLFAAIVLCGAASAATTTWHTETPASHTTTAGYSDNSIALDSHGHTHISYYDNSNSDLKYARWTGTSWSKTTVDNAGNVGWLTSLALDSNNNPRISYVNVDGDLKYSYLAEEFSISEIKNAGNYVANYIATNHKLPNYAYIAGYKFTMPQFLELAVTALLKINSGISSNSILGYYEPATAHAENIKAGKIYKNEYIAKASYIKNLMDGYGKSPLYIQTSLGVFTRFSTVINMYAKILNFHKATGVLPAYILVKPWSQI